MSGDLRAFLLARVTEFEAAVRGTSKELEARDLRRDVVRHSESHICDNGYRADPAETLDSVDDHDWCDHLRALSVQYADHSDFDDRWRPWQDAYWDDVLD